MRQLTQIPDLLEQEEEPYSEDSQKCLLRRALAMLRGDFEEKTWQAFWRMTVDGHAAAEIAADLGMSAKTVRQAKYRVLCRLRQEMEGM